MVDKEQLDVPQAAAAAPGDESSVPPSPPPMPANGFPFAESSDDAGGHSDAYARGDQADASYDEADLSVVELSDATAAKHVPPPPPRNELTLGKSFAVG